MFFAPSHVLEALHGVITACRRRGRGGEGKGRRRRGRGGKGEEEGSGRGGEGRERGGEGRERGGGGRGGEEEGEGRRRRGSDGHAVQKQPFHLWHWARHTLVAMRDTIPVSEWAAPPINMPPNVHIKMTHLTVDEIIITPTRCQ